MQELHDPSLVPNHTLRHLIDQWARTGLQLDAQITLETDADASLVLLKRNLECDQTTVTIKIQYVGTVRALLEEFPPIRSRFLQLGFLSLLLDLIFGQSESGFSCDRLRLAGEGLPCVLELLALGGFKSLNTLQEGSKLTSFQIVFEHGNNSVKVLMCKLIKMISLSSETKFLCCMLGECCKLLREIILLVQLNDEEVSRAAMIAIQGLCSLELNRDNLVKEGAVSRIIEFVMRAEKESRLRGLTAVAGSMLEQLLGVDEGKQALLNHPSGIIALVRNVFRISSDQESSESAVNSLLIVCSGKASFRAREEAIDAGVLSQILLLLQSQCSSRTKTKARMLLTLLRS